jgi:4-aminobutyrate aminotransferase-like enzyme
MADSVSNALFERAKRVIPGGVNSPVRAFRAVGGDPVFIARASGARLFAADGRELVDYVGSWGPAILGHAHPDVVRAVQAAAEGGLSFGAPTELEVRFAERLKQLYPTLGKLRCVSSGTEATMSAIRAARGFTKRDVVLKFEGCYHGHADHLLVKAGSGLATQGVPDSAGVPEGTARTTATLPFNDAAALEDLFSRRGPEIACAIVEPVVGNMGCVPPAPGFLAKLLELCASSGAVSIFDEVMTGCRLAPGGAQELFGLRPDMTTLGKIVGGGMPPEPRALREARAPGRRAGGRARRRRQGGGRARLRPACGFHDHPLLPRGAGPIVERRRGQRHQALRRLAPRAPGARDLLAPVPVRGCVLRRRPHRGRHRPHAHRGARGPQGLSGRVTSPRAGRGRPPCWPAP